MLRTGALDSRKHRSCLEALHQTGERAGKVAQAVGGVTAVLLSDALKLQLTQRFVALLELAASDGHDAWLELRPVPDSERSARLPLGSLQRRVARLAAGVAGLGPPEKKDEARRALRALAKALHPDLHAHLDDESRQRLCLELARATALYHGFG